MEIETSNLLSNINGIKHGFFYKRFGCSTGNFESLNCSYKVGDDEEAVSMNLDRVKNYMQADALFSLNQEHGKNVIFVDENTDLNLCNQKITADALVTKTPKIAIGILTADCAPVLLYDTQEKIIAAMHCGWRSARFGVIENTLSLIKSIGGGKNVFASIGPCIQKENYQVKSDFIDEFLPYEIDMKHFTKIDNGYLFDLHEYIKTKLINLSVKKVEILHANTMKEFSSYFSFRRANLLSNGICGRQISCIMLDFSIIV